MTPSSLLNTDITAMITGFAGDIVPTVIGLLTIIVPVGLTLWAVGFGIRKGLGYLKKNAKTSV